VQLQPSHKGDWDFQGQVPSDWDGVTLRRRLSMRGLTKRKAPSLRKMFQQY
jgi:hypothetical protein